MTLKEEFEKLLCDYKGQLDNSNENSPKVTRYFSQKVVSDEVDNKSQPEELVEDIISLIHSFSGKLYGLRQKIKEEIKCNEKSQTRI